MTRAPGARGDALALVLSVGIGSALAACGSGCSRAPGGQPAIAARGTTRVPVVITPPRPFRLAHLDSQPRAVGTPATTPLRPKPTAAPGAAGPTVATTALPEPRPFPGAADNARPAAAEIGLMLRDYARAFNRRDAAMLAAYWSPTAENVDLDTGEVTRGREAVHDVFAALFDTERSGRLDLDIGSIRLVRPDVAVVDAQIAVSFTERERGSAPARRRLAAVVVRRDDHWQLDSVRESSLPGAAAAEPPREPRPLEQLAFLVGSWEGQCAGATVTTRCSWAADGGFLLRNHVVAAHARPAEPAAGGRGIPGLLVPGSAGTREISEVIAFDPKRDQIRSWYFTSQGRFAEGTWSRSGDRWQIAIEGKGADSTARGRVELARIGPGECAVSCAADELLDVCPPACELVRVD